jgi:hypothetical protein
MTTTTCPKCGGTIQAAAIKCKHCQADVSPSSRSSTAMPADGPFAACPEKAQPSVVAVLLALACFCTVAAPLVLRFGPKAADVAEQSRDLSCWMEINDKIDAIDAVRLPQRWDSLAGCPTGTEATVLRGDEIRKEEARIDEAEAAIERRVRMENPGLSGEPLLLRIAGAKLRLPEVISWSEVSNKIRQGKDRLWERQRQRLITIALAFCLLVAALSFLVAATRNVPRLCGTNESRVESYRRLRRYRRFGRALIPAVMCYSVIGGFLSWNWNDSYDAVDVGLFYIPHAASILQVISFWGSLTVLVLLNSVNGLLEILEKEPEVLAADRLDRWQDEMLLFRNRRGVEQASAKRVVDEKQTFLDTLRAASPDSPAVAQAEEALAEARRRLADLESGKGAGDDGFVDELKALQAAITEKRAQLSVLKKGGAPDDVVASARAAVNEVRQQFAALADRVAAATPRR